MTELWDVYDVHRVKTGATAMRRQEFENDELHVVVSVCLFNSKGQMLIQQRAVDKEGWPNYWDWTATGSIVAGETSQQGAARELFEEMGITHDFTNVRPQFTVNFPRGFADFYCIEKEVDLQQIVMQQEEVQAVKWASVEDIQAMVASGLFIPYYTSLIQMLFDMRGRYGTRAI